MFSGWSTTASRWGPTATAQVQVRRRADGRRSALRALAEGIARRRPLSSPPFARFSRSFAANRDDHVVFGPQDRSTQGRGLVSAPRTSRVSSIDVRSRCSSCRETCRAHGNRRGIGPGMIPTTRRREIRGRRTRNGLAMDPVLSVGDAPSRSRRRRSRRRWFVTKVPRSTGTTTGSSRVAATRRPAIYPSEATCAGGPRPTSVDSRIATPRRRPIDRVLSGVRRATSRGVPTARLSINARRHARAACAPPELLSRGTRFEERSRDPGPAPAVADPARRSREARWWRFRRGWRAGVRSYLA